MTFKKGESGNPNGRPTLEAKAMQGLTKTELSSTNRLLKRHVMAAIQKIIDGMHDEEIPKKDRLKYAKDVYDMFMKGVSMEHALRRAATTGSENGVTDDEDEVEKAPVVRLSFSK